MVEPFHISQLDEVMDIWLSTNQKAHNFIPQAFWHQAFEEVKAALPEAQLYVYRHQGEVLGFVGVQNNGYIAGLFVKEAYQSKGIGKALLNECKKAYNLLTLDVFCQNTRAISFYEKNGFVITEKTVNEDFGHQEYRLTYRGA